MRNRPLYVAYHDQEWGIPERDSRALWEKLMLEGFQAGLSWITILRKRDAFRRAFDGFTPETIARWGEDDVRRLLADPGIVRHRGKIENTIRAAAAFQRIEARGGFSAFIWQFQTVRCKTTCRAHPATSQAKARVGSAVKSLEGRRTFVLRPRRLSMAFMQAAGLVNDHIVSCPARHATQTGGPETPSMTLRHPPLCNLRRYN